MSDDLSNDQIALLCDIEEQDFVNVEGKKKRDLEWLLAGGYVELASDRPNARLQLTAKGSTLLVERGVGLNEA